MKRFLSLLDSNRGSFFITLFVGILYSVICIIVPNISGELLNAVVKAESEVNYLTLIAYIIFSIMQIIFFMLDDYQGEQFKIRQKRMMRKNAVEAFTLNTTAGKRDVSSCSSFVNNDIPLVTEQYFFGTIDIAKCLCLIILSSLSLFRINWTFALIIIGISILIILVPKILKNEKNNLNESLSNSLARYNTGLASVLNGINLLHAYLYHKRANKRLESLNEKIAEDEGKLVNRNSMLYGVTGILQVSKSALILIVGVYLISVGEIDVGGLVVVLQLAEIIAAPIEVLASLLHWRKESKPLIDKYNEMILGTNKVIQKSDIELSDFGNIGIKNLSYEIKGVHILQDITITFEQGKKYIITGHSGSGKSTLIRLLSRIGDVNYTGVIEYDGIDIATVDQRQLAMRVCTVFQEPYLFHEDLKENILMGRDIPQNQFDEVIDKLNLRYIINRYAGKQITPEIMERLSGGEKQRIALARAMVGKPPIYLLDEITSSLDAENANQIEQVLLHEKATVVHVCHKPNPALIDQYDRHIVIENGRMSCY